MKEIIDDIINNLDHKDFIEQSYLHNTDALDKAVENYCIDKGFIYYSGDFQALDAEEKREYLSELSYELKFFRYLYQNHMLKNKSLLFQFLKKYKIFEALTQYDYHSTFNDYFTADDMKKINHMRNNNI